MKEAKPKRDYVRYTVQDKARFFDLKIEKCMTASAAAKQLGIHPRTAYRWVSQSNACPDSIFESCKKTGRKCILTEEHKTTVINFIDANPSATVVEVTEHLLKRFHGLKVSRSTVNNFMRHMDFLTNCVFLDKSAFDINMKRSRAWSNKGTRAIVTRPTTRANTVSILGAISASGLITVGVKKPRPAKKRKSDGYISSGTVTGHYISFLKTTLDEMDKHPHMKGHYIVMDNALIHTHENIKKYIEYRGYKCVYLPTYSPELNPIEQFWAVAKRENGSYQSNQKAVNHIAAIHQKKGERLLSGHRNFGMYSQANVQKYERLGYSIVVHYDCVSCKETFVVKEELRKHCDWSHVMASQPENGIITAPDDIIKLSWIFCGPDNDHLVFQNIDITKGFHEFRHCRIYLIKHLLFV
ncbi:hypothetical protein G6F42_004120 [Rhizopus arrhizus]|nr:hypothetical protein G6F42_004120 [Rhizopus arrhizus]